MEPRKKYKIGYVPGVYDLFHIGHLNLIRRAKEQSEYLIAGVLTDELVEHFKHKKPYIPFEERLEIVGAIKEVDEVIKVDFTNTVKMDAWNVLHYDAYFSGSDHGSEWDREKKLLQEVGSDIVFFSYTKSTSSTMIKAQMQERSTPKRLYLFGAGKIGQNTLMTLQEKYKDVWKVEGFLDNSTEKYLTRIMGIPVYHPEDLKTLEMGEDYYILITMKVEDMAKRQIGDMGLVKQIITGINND